MNRMFCGLFPPVEDKYPAGAEFFSEFSSCLRRRGHAGEHIFKKNTGEYACFEEDWDCYDPEGQDLENDIRCVLLWDVNTKYAEKILSEEKPVN